MKRAILALVFLFPFLLFGQGFNVLNFYPSLDEKGGITGYSSFYGDVWKFNMLSMLLYERSPLEAGSSRKNTIKIIPHLAVFYWGAKINLPYKFQAGLLLPWNLYAKITDPYNEIYRNVSSFGDIRYFLKYSFREIGKLPGLGMMAAGTIPSGNPEFYLGDTSFLFTLTGIADYALGPHYFYLNLSFTFRSPEEVMNLNLSNQFDYVLGYSFPRGEKINLTVELNGATPLNHPFRNEAVNPVELNSVVKVLGKPFNWGFVAGTGITKGIGTPDYRIGVFLSYPPMKPEVFTYKIVKPEVKTDCLTYFQLPPSKRRQNEKCEKAEYGYIVGRVTNFSNFPISGSFVIVKPGNLEIPVKRDGSFVVKLRPGIYYLRAHKKLFTSTEAFIEVKPRSGRRVHLKKRYIEGKVIIRLFNASLVQIPGVIKIFSGTQIVKKYRISKKGAMISLPPGEYIIEGGIPGFKTVSKIVDVLPNKSVEVDLILK